MLAGYVLIVLAVLLPGCLFWYRTGGHIAACIYGNAMCAAAAWTAVLCALTLAALCAAILAALYARSTLIMEREVILSLDQCLLGPFDGSSRAADVRHEPYIRENWYLESLASENAQFARGTPPSVEYGRRDFDCFSVGRSPLINGRLPINWRSPNGNGGTLSIDIGCIPADQFVHLTLWLPPAVADVQFSWGEVAKHRVGSDSKAVGVEFNVRDRDFGKPGKAMVQNTAVSDEAPSNITIGAT